MVKDPPRLTEEQYLSLERQALTRSEFHDGLMFAMAGGSLNHSLLAASIGALLQRPSSPGCRTLSSDMRIKIEAASVYTYPDCLVVCGEPRLASGDCLLNPTVIVEVLSPSTEAYDRGRKFELYRTIDSFTVYLLIHQDRPRVEHYEKQSAGTWLLRDCIGRDSVIDIGSLGIRIPLDELYTGTIGVE